MLAKMYGSNPSIQGQICRFKRLGGLGRGRTREGGGRNESSLGKGNLTVGFESMLGARIHSSEIGAEIHGSELGAEICGFEVPATSTPPRRLYCARSDTSEPHTLSPSKDSKPTARSPLPRLLSFLPPSSRVLPLLNPSNLLNRRI